MNKDIEDYLQILEEKRGSKFVKELEPLGGKIFNGYEARDCG